MMAYDYPHPVSRTYQYKKITKPLLERKRRARINRCLEELKDLMVDALETEGENISKLEKADILELTVRHLQRLQASRPSGLSSSGTPSEEASAESRWRSGFGHCATEACRFLATLPGEAADRLARHLATGLQLTRQINVQVVSKSDLVSPTLATLNKTANLLVPSGSSTDVATTVSPRRNSSQKNVVQSYSGKAENSENFLTVKFPYVSLETTVNSMTVDVPRTTSDSSTDSDSEDTRNLSMTMTKNIGTRKNKVEESQMIVDDEEEEMIDVEHVDDRDPMWRPW